MKRLVHSVKVFWRTERLLTEQQLKLATGRLQLTAIAAFAAIAGLIMLNIAAFFALSTYWGNALAALTMGGVDFVIAAALAFSAGSMKAGSEIETIKEMRDMALTDIEEEADLAGAELIALRTAAHRFFRHPADALLPGIVGPLLAAFAKHSGETKTKKADE